MAWTREINLTISECVKSNQEWAPEPPQENQKDMKKQFIFNTSAMIT